MRKAEEWVPVPWDGRYEVSTLGRVRTWNRPRGRKLRETPLIMSPSPRGGDAERRMESALWGAGEDLGRRAMALALAA